MIKLLLGPWAGQILASRTSEAKEPFQTKFFLASSFLL